MPQLSFGAPLYGRKGAPAEILNRPLCRLHVKTAVPRLIDARSLPAGKRCRRAAMVKRRAQTGCLRGYLHFQHLNLGRMFYRGHSFLGVLTSPRIGNRNRCCPVWRAAVCAFGQGRDFPPRQCIIRHCAQKCNRLCKRRGESRLFRRRRGVFGTKSRKPAPGKPESFCGASAGCGISAKIRRRAKAFSFFARRIIGGAAGAVRRRGED